MTSHLSQQQQQQQQQEPLSTLHTYFYGNRMSTSETKKRRSDVGISRPRKQLSCQRCRLRKVKCSYEVPCANCVKDGVECVQPVDMRSRRPKASHVMKLETRVSSLVGFINTLKSCNSMEEKNKLVAELNLDQFLKEADEATSTLQVPPPPSQQQQQQSGGAPTAGSTTYTNEDDAGAPHSSAIYGPTSIYDDAILHNNAGSSSKHRDNSVDIIVQMSQDPDILRCLHLFFTWQYPDHNMFIFREAFLIDFFAPKSNSLYCSKILVLSICALGARMSDDRRIYNKSKEFYQQSKNLLLATLSKPSITSLQSYMLLAFYDICNGHNSSGWMLSGSAIRMGFDLGFQLNPELWFVKSKGDVGDVAIRSRVYWGCYMADHFISLLLGRPSILKLSDASIPETSDLPDLSWIDDYTYAGYLKLKGRHQTTAVTSYISDPLNQIINLINISDNMLNDIFTKSDDLGGDHQGNDDTDLNLNSRWEKLFQYNRQIVSWKKSLPKDLQWDRESLSKTGENPTYSGIRYYYYILLLCLNRPFVGIENDNKGTGEDELSPLSVCLEAIDDLYESINRFQQEHGYRVCSIFIVYSSILSISILLLTNSRIQLVSEQRDRLHFFMGVLHGCSKTWKLAERSYNLVKEKIQQVSVKDERQENNNNDNISSSNNNNNSNNKTIDAPTPLSSVGSTSDTQQQQNMMFDDNIDFLGGPPVLMTADLFNEDWEALFPDYVFNSKS
ncbi:putative transcriptional regulatory protein [Candida tropicalis]